MRRLGSELDEQGRCDALMRCEPMRLLPWGAKLVQRILVQEADALGVER